MYNIAKPAQTPNLASRIRAGTSPSHSFTSAAQSPTVERPAIVFIREIELRGPASVTISPDSKVEIDSDREAMIELT